jgi:hypothetical protein
MLLEDHTVRGQLVDVGRVDGRIPIAAEATTDIVGDDEQDVGLWVHAGLPSSGRAGTAFQYPSPALH